MQRRGRKFHSEPVRNSIEPDKVHAVRVLNGHAESDVLHSHLAKFFQGRVASVETVRKTADRVVCLLKAFDGNADTDIREFLAEVNDAVSEESVCRDNDSVTLLSELANNIFEVCPDEGLPACDICKVHGRKFLPQHGTASCNGCTYCSARCSGK